MADGSDQPDDGVRLYAVENLWADSTGDPLGLYESDDPAVQTGTYVIRPGERVPETGTTSHGGPEISVILSGEAVLGIPSEDAEHVLSGGTLSIIPAGVEHYSENRGDDPVRLVYTVVGEL